MASVNGTMATEGLPGAPTSTVISVMTAGLPDALAAEDPISERVVATAKTRNQNTRRDGLSPFIAFQSWDVKASTTRLIRRMYTYPCRLSLDMRLCSGLS